ncbi:MAG: reverse transcriptase family protein [Bacteroidia bacterium]
MYALYFPYSVKMRSRQIGQISHAFCKLKRQRDLAAFLQEGRKSLLRIVDSASSDYYSFRMPKREGGSRLIETPREELKDIQTRINHILQCVYHGLRPDCAFGFIITAKDDTEARNIYTNACKHLGQSHVLNLDLKDFFHTITSAKVENIFLGSPFRFKPKAARTLARLTTFRKRLPMGAPSSPIISNFACLEMDAKLQEYADKRGWKYTRFSDDLTLSSGKKIYPNDIAAIFEIIRECGFEPNEEKVNLYKKSDPPIVTGLRLLPEFPDIAEDYIEGIRSDMEILQMLGSDKRFTRSIFQQFPAEKLRRSIIGQINFVGFVRGRQHDSFLALMKELYKIPYAKAS